MPVYLYWHRFFQAYINWLIIDTVFTVKFPAPNLPLTNEVNAQQSDTVQGCDARKGE